MSVTDITHFYHQVDQIKREFIDNCQVKRKYEAFKIWARWLITHQSLHKQPNWLLPSVATDNDLQITTELVNKGCSVVQAQHLYQELTYQVQKLVATTNLEAPQASFTVTVTPHDNKVNLAYSKFKHDVSSRLYQQLCHRVRALPAPAQAQAIWQMLTAYYLLDGKSLQWAVPGNLMYYFQQQFGCNTEIFASPINVTYDQYYSLFPYTDSCFGSKGNFFTAPDSQFQSGCYEVNPPFIDILFTETSRRILELLVAADQNQRDLTFIYVLPDWDDLEGYDLLIGSRFCSREITLKTGEHYYYQSQKECYIQVHFSTKVLFLSTNPNICNHQQAGQIVAYFRNPTRRDRSWETEKES